MANKDSRYRMIAEKLEELKEKSSEMDDGEAELIEKQKLLDEKRKELGFCESSRLLPEKCRICPWAALCRNGCRRNRADPSGADGALNYFCPAYQMFFSHCDSRLREVAAQVKSTLSGNPARPSSG